MPKRLRSMPYKSSFALMIKTKRIMGKVQSREVKMITT